MNDLHHDKVKSIFLSVCDLEGSERQERLQEACGSDQELMREVESLLRYHQPDTLLGGLSDTNIHSRSRPPTESRHSWVGAMLGRHRVVGLLDSGGMGTVLEGFDTAIQRRVAIKVLHAQLAQDDSLRMRFLAEARSAGNLNHPNVITIFEVAETAELPYLVMEFAENGSAADHVAKHGAYSVEEATRMTIEACSGLAAAHSIGFVHRDVKPANLLVMADGTVKVSDFGIAKATRNSAVNLTQTGQIVGTPNFMSPEQCEGGEIDARSDVYSLGATFYSLLVGENPFNDKNSLVSVVHAHCSAPPPDPRSVDPSIPAWCAEVVKRAMAKKADDRFPDMAAMEEALRLQEPGAALQKKPKRRVILAAAALLLLGAGAALFFPWQSGPGDQDPAQAAGVDPAGAPEPILVGLLHSLTGTMAQSERGMVDAYELAIEEINDRGGLLGRPVRSISRDGRSRDSVFAEQAERLISEEGVCTLFGCVTSSSRKAVKEVVEQHDHLLVYSVNHEGLETSPNIIYLGGGPSHTVIPAARWAYGFLNKRKFFLVGSDYVYPRVVNEILKDELTSMGADVVGEEYLRLGDTDVGAVVDAIKLAQPDMIINTISGDTQFVFFRVLRSREVMAPQLATGVGEEERWGVGDEHVFEDYTIATYFQSLRNKENEDFVSRFHAKFGERRVINASMETAYAAVHMWADAVEEAGSIEPGAINDALLGREYEAPGGRILIDPETRYAHRSFVIGKIRKAPEFQIVLRGPSLIAPAPYPTTRTREQWQELLDELQTEWNGGWSAP